MSMVGKYFFGCILFGVMHLIGGIYRCIVVGVVRNHDRVMVFAYLAPLEPESNYSVKLHALLTGLNWRLTLGGDLLH